MVSENIRYTHNFKSTCNGCGTGCGIRISRHRNGNLLLEGDWDHPVNKGILCRKALDLKYSINDDSFRLRNPMVRYNKAMSLKTSDWDKTMERVVAVTETFIKKFGPESIAFYISQNLLNEDYYLIQKLVKRNIGSTQLYSMNSLMNSVNISSFYDGLEKDFSFASYSDLELTECLFVTSNIADSHPLVWNGIMALKTSKPSIRIISIGALENEVSKMADLHLCVFPGTENLLYQAIGKCLIQGKQTDIDFATRNPLFFENYKKDVSKLYIDSIAKTCGIIAKDIEKAAEWISSSKAFVSLWTEGDEIYNSTSRINSFTSLINLHLITGKFNKIGSGPMLLMQSSNARGSLEIEKSFYTHPHASAKNARSTEQLLQGLKAGNIKLLWAIGADVFKEFPNNSMVEEGLKNARFIVYQGTDQNSAIINYADAVLPAKRIVEKEGTIFNAFGGLSNIPEVTLAPGKALSDVAIISRFANLMGYPGFDHVDNQSITSELLTHLKISFSSAANIDYNMLQKHKVYYFTDASETSTEGIGLLNNTKANKRNTLAISEIVLSNQDDNFPYYLELTAFVKEKAYHRFLPSNILDDYSNNTFLLINPSDAEALQVQSNELIEVSSSLGGARAKAIISPGVKKGSVFAFINSAKTSKEDINQWESLLGGFSNQFKSAPVAQKVQLKKYIKEKQKIVIIGAGAAAFGFVKAYRKINKIDEIEIFSKEKTPFYDRFKLPEYLSGTHLWDQLLKMDKEEEASLNIFIHRGMSIIKVDRENKFVIDAEENRTYYDILIIATGSRAAKPKNTPKKTGIFTMRSRNDAETFRNNVPKNAEVVIVGGGILGLEVASSLREKGAKVTIIQRTSRFLDRQLDALGSEILHEELTDLGCDIYYNDEVQLYFGQTTITGVGLKSGRKIPCQAMVIAIGNIPNIHLAKESGLASKVGILVNGQLRTEDPFVFAIGEVAEINGNLFSFPLAAEEQAAIAAHFIHGDQNSFYHGSLLRNTIKLQGREICSIGLVEAPDDKNYEEIMVLDKKKRYYKKCIICQDMLVGTILIGDKSEFEVFGDLIEKRIKLKDIRDTLLRNQTTGLSDLQILNRRNIKNLKSCEDAFTAQAGKNRKIKSKLLPDPER